MFPITEKPFINLIRTGDQALIRQINLSVIMSSLRKNAPISRAALATATGLNKTTVSSLVNELIKSQFVRENGSTKSGTGRPAIMLTLNPAAGYIVSCEIGVDFILVVCTDFAPEIVWRQEEHIDPGTDQRTILNRALVLLSRAIETWRDSTNGLLGIAVGVPGLVDQVSGTLLFAPNLGWKNVPLRTILQDTLNYPVYVDNEATIAALGENYFGAAQGYHEILYISAGVGLGGGIIHGGKVFSGATGVGAEFGHMTMDPNGETCNCGNRGCWETQVSQSALFRYARKSIESGETSVLIDMVEGKFERLTVPLIVKAAQQGDKVALDAFGKIGHYLGIGIASLVNALNPELVVFGGGLSRAGEFILPVLEKVLIQRALPWTRGATKLVLAHHGSDACVMGGVAAVYQTILAKPGQSGPMNNETPAHLISSDFVSVS